VTQRDSRTADETDKDVPIPLDRAVEICFPYGGIKAATLKIAVRRGDLEYEKIGRAYFVTKAGVARWREANTRKPKALDTPTDRAAAASEKLRQVSSALIKAGRKTTRT
jgi:hypothetical protein